MAGRSVIRSDTQIAPPPGATPGQIVFVGPDGTLVTGAAYVIQEIPPGTVPGPVAGGYDITTVTAAPSVVQDTAPGTVITGILALGVTNPVYSGRSDDGVLAVVGNNIVTGPVPADYTVAQVNFIKVRAQSADGKTAIEETMAVAVTQLGAGGPIYDINLVSNTSSGSASIANITVVQADALNAKNADGSVVQFLANQLRRTTLGARISAETARFVSKNATKPNLFVPIGYVNPVRTPLAAEGIFTPYRIDHTVEPTSSGLKAEQTEPAVPDNWYVVTWKCKPTADNPGMGAQFGIKQTIPAIPTYYGNFVVSVSNLAASSAPNGAYNPGGVVWSVVRHGMQADGTYELVIKIMAKNADMEAWMAGADFTTDYQSRPLIHYAIFVEKGEVASSIVSTGNVTYIRSGDNVTLGGTIPQPLTLAEGTMFIETYEMDSIGRILTAGATEVLAWAGWTAVKAKAGIITAAVGLGGSRGISIIGLRKTNVGIDICINGGAIVSSVGAVNWADVLRLFETSTGYLRRITGYNSALSNAAFRSRTNLYNRTLVNAPNSIRLGARDLTFEDDFNGTYADTIMERADPLVYPAVSFGVHMNYYRGRPGKWVPRYVQWTSPQGMGQIPINDEWEYYIDPQHPVWDASAKSVLTVANGNLTLKAMLVAGASFEANIPTRIPGSTMVDTGVKFRYVSAVATTAASFEQKGGYFEARIKNPVEGLGIWPAFWMLPGMGPDFASTAEIDVHEGVGRYFGHTSHAIHTGGSQSGYTDNRGAEVKRPYMWADDYHTFGVEWILGVGLQFYIDGAKEGPLVSSVGTNLDLWPMYMLLNLAVGDGGGWQGVPDATTDAKMPVTMAVDWVRALSIPK